VFLLPGELVHEVLGDWGWWEEGQDYCVP
jgi:hypothetical protein